MTGRTNMLVGTWMNRYTHVPITLAVSRRKKIDPDGWMWAAHIAVVGTGWHMRFVAVFDGVKLRQLRKTSAVTSGGQA